MARHWPHRELDGHNLSLQKGRQFVLPRQPLLWLLLSSLWHCSRPSADQTSYDRQVFDQRQRLSMHMCLHQSCDLLLALLLVAGSQRRKTLQNVQQTELIRLISHWADTRYTSVLATHCDLLATVLDIQIVPAHERDARAWSHSFRGHNCGQHSGTTANFNSEIKRRTSIPWMVERPKKD